MIIGRTQSADGGFRRIPIRHTQIVDEATRQSLVSYLKGRVYQKCKESNWVGYKDIFPNLPDDILDTPLNVPMAFLYKEPSSLILSIEGCRDN